MSGLAENIKMARLRKGMSARAVSLQAGLSPSYVGKLESGEIEPSVRAAASIVRVLGLTSHEILFTFFSESAKCR